METQVHLISYKESLLMAENKLEKILDGVSVIMPPPTTGHFRFVRQLSRELERVFPELEMREPSDSESGHGCLYLDASGPRC